MKYLVRAGNALAHRYGEFGLGQLADVNQGIDSAQGFVEELTKKLRDQGKV